MRENDSTSQSDLIEEFINDLRLIAPLIPLEEKFPLRLESGDFGLTDEQYGETMLKLQVAQYFQLWMLNKKIQVLVPTMQIILNNLNDKD